MKARLGGISGGMRGGAGERRPGSARTMLDGANARDCSKQVDAAADQQRKAGGCRGRGSEGRGHALRRRSGRGSSRPSCSLPVSPLLSPPPFLSPPHLTGTAAGSCGSRSHQRGKLLGRSALLDTPAAVEQLVAGFGGRCCCATAAALLVPALRSCHSRCGRPLASPAARRGRARPRAGAPALGSAATRSPPGRLAGRS